MFTRLVATVCFVLTLINAAAATADGWIDLAIPLRDGRFYSRNVLLHECRTKLGIVATSALGPDREIELTGLDKAVLKLAERTDLLKVQFESNKFFLSIPDREDDQVRRQTRKWLEQLLNVPLTEWPADLGLHCPDDFNATIRTVLLIHGMEGNRESLQPLKTAFESAGVQVLFFDYPNDGPVAWSGDRLSEDLSKLSKSHRELRLAVVAHSMGGLVARYAVETPGKNPGCVSDLFLLGTPNNGSRLASGQPLLELLQESPFRVDWMPALMTDGLGEAAEDLQPGSRFLNRLNAQKRAQGVRYYTAIGRKSVIAEDQRAALAAETIRLFDRRSTPRNVRQRILDVLASDELRDGFGDGAVSVASAKLTGADREKVFDLNHMQLLTPGNGTDGLFGWIIEALGWPRVAQ